MSILTNLRANLNGILGLRDSLGVAKSTVYIATQTWTGTEIGDGTMTETTAQMLPTPYIFVFTADRKIPEGGVVAAGDIILRQISMQSYPNESQIDCSSTLANVEKLYKIDGNYYRVIEVTKKHVTWKVTLKRLSKPRSA